MRVTWLGHAAYLLSDGETSVVIDPYGDLLDSPAPERRWDYPPIEGVQGDVVLITHDHGDHNRPEAIGGDPVIVRWKAGRIKTPVGEVRGVVSEHDDQAGSLRGGNIIFVLTVGDVRVCHMGDFGQRALRDEQAEAIGPVDLLMLPVGGGSTSSPEEAAAVAERIGPRWVLPMHYRTRYVDFMEPVDSYLAYVGAVHRLDESSFETSELPDTEGSTCLLLPVPQPGLGQAIS